MHYFTTIPTIITVFFQRANCAQETGIASANPTLSPQNANNLLQCSVLQI